MRLTSYLRQAFVDAALADVPKIDYLEQARSRANLLASRAREDAGLPQQTNPDRLAYQNITVYYTPSSGKSGWAHFAAPGLLTEEATLIAKDLQLIELCIKHHDQQASHNALRTKLQGVADSVNTDKQLIELLPEFAKYLPQPETKQMNLPAISNVVGEFIRAGWPKDRKTSANSKAQAA